MVSEGAAFQNLQKQKNNFLENYWKTCRKMGLFFLQKIIFAKENPNDNADGCCEMFKGNEN